MRELYARHLWRYWLIAGVCLVAGPFAGGSVAQAKVIRIHGHGYGVTYSPSAVARQRAGGQIPTTGPSQSNLVYNGGPLMLNSTVYLIFWGSTGSFAASYENPIIQWAKDLAAADATNVDEFSVTRQYTDGSNSPITGKVLLGAAVNDTDAYPSKAAPCTSDSNPCLTDAQLQAEITHEISVHSWPTDAPGTPAHQYIVLTPNGVDGCDDSSASDCTFGSNGYCGYHSEIGLASGNVAVYTALPYVSGCDSGQAPAGTAGNADTDGSLDTLIHELAEAATDPDGGGGYTDPSGYEIGDKCDGQSVALTQAEIYGTPLGGSLGANTAFNQLIGGHSYYTQQLWSNAPTKTPSSTTAAGCAQRLGASPSFSPPSNVSTGKSATFTGSGSYDIASPITSYSWKFGDGSTVQTAENPGHIYDAPGTYTVSLTVGDAGGSAGNSTESAQVTVTGTKLVPSITGVSPASAITGSTVTISGSNLASASAVRFNGVAAPVSSDTTTQIKATVPNGATSGPITVITAGGTATSPSSFTVPLSVTGFSPASGPHGTSVTITGVGFTPSSAVKFNGVAASSSTFDSSTKLTATVPTGATTGPITVTNTTAPAGTVRSASSYTVTPFDPPTIGSFSPTSAITGSTVTVTGTYLSGASSVELGSLQASYRLVSATEITLKVPNGAVPGKITVKTAAGQASSTAAFTPTFSITGFSPVSGAAGTVVTISGVGFTTTSTVKFNGTAATHVTFDSSTKLTATVPAGATNGPITVTNTAAPAGTVQSATSYAV